ncbi:tetratricopeptide repeat protein [Ramlibacter sp. 2FC]|uniref:tetratricopeptide repeat protein n=1 Tax=Ramlibacter sp. 2FC TaxID=2502188 RepID=UPI0010F4D431|nr:tetratricopeptide repeat protein [Ramlibacter sp. 2FC]
MGTTDSLGLALSGAGADSAHRYEQALHQLQCYMGDPVATIDAAIAERPDFAMGHVLHAWLNLLGTEPAALPVARQDLARLMGLACTPRERTHGQAIAAWLDGRWRDAARLLEDLSLEHPRDALALQAGHVLDFYLGDARMLRDRLARALPAWSPAMPGYHALLGMQAFGLEETGAYGRAEAQGRAALELEPRDAWAHHAVAHVMEMQGRTQEGIAWMRERQSDWAEDNFFAVHNWWHRALYHLDLGEIDQVLALFDGPVFGGRSTLALDLVDASALLWRLQLRGVALGGRWHEVAERWLSFADTAYYAFNDAHAMMAFVGDGRVEAQQTLLAAQARAMAGQGDNAGFTREVGAPLVQAIQAFGAGEWRRTAELLRPLRGIAQRFGGSHAQRDLIDLTLIEAALRDGQQALARGLAAERVDAKPASPSARELLRRAG